MHDQRVIRIYVGKFQDFIHSGLLALTPVLRSAHFVLLANVAKRDVLH
jgi:hypothetical protein